MLLKDIVEKIGGQIQNSQGHSVQTPIHRLAPLHLAQPGDVSFYTNQNLKSLLTTTQATAVITKQLLKEEHFIQIVHPNPQAAMAQVAQIFDCVEHTYQGISQQAFVSPHAHIHSSANIYPFAYVEAGAQLDPDCVIYPYVFVGKNCRVGARTVIYPGAVLMDETQVGEDCIIHAGSVLGADGFGFAPTQERLEKIPQNGRVVLENHVEIGGLVTIDRATFEATIIRKGSKLDSHVHVGHNVDLGEMSMLCGQSAIAGSTKIGKRFIAAGQAGIGPGLTIGEHIIVGAQAGLITSESEPGEYFGMPATRGKDWHRQMLALKKLPDLLKTVRKLEAQIAQLENPSRSGNDL